MQRGKVSEITLKRSVLKNAKSKNQSILQNGEIDFDASVVNMEADGQDCLTGENKLEGITTVMSSNIIDTNFDGSAEYYVNKTLNNIYASGAIPRAAELGISIPTDYDEKNLGKLIRTVRDAFDRKNICITGGQTIVSSNVSSPIIMFTVIGNMCYNYFLHGNDGLMSDEVKQKSVSDNNNMSLKNVTPGQDIVMTKSIAIGGTAIISKLREEDLNRRFTPGFVKKCIDMNKFISVEKEAGIAVTNGAVALHDISTGGVFAGFWELTTLTGHGVEIYHENIPVWQETIEVAELFDINPYKLDGSGSLLIVCDDGKTMVKKLEEQGIAAAVIGKITDNKDRVVVRKSDDDTEPDERRFLEPQRGDEIYKFI